MAPTKGIEVERLGEVFLVHLQGPHLDETRIQASARAISDLIEVEGCRKLVLCLNTLICLYSELLAKLYSIQRLMQKHNGRMKLCEVPPMVREVFQIAKMEPYFEFVADRDRALLDW
jgi:anti-sigma B factor antagonist